MKDFDSHLNAAWWALRIAIGVGPIATGVDKYFNKLTDWTMYLSPLATKMIPVKDTTFMHIVGVVEVIAGIIVLTRWTRIGSYIVGLWLLAIVANLLTTGMFYDLAIRDRRNCCGGVRASPTKPGSRTRFVRCCNNASWHLGSSDPLGPGHAINPASEKPGSLQVVQLDQILFKERRS